MQYDQEIPQPYNADQHKVTLEIATDQSLISGSANGRLTVCALIPCMDLLLIK